MLYKFNEVINIKNEYVKIKVSQNKVEINTLDELFTVNITSEELKRYITSNRIKYLYGKVIEQEIVVYEYLPISTISSYSLGESTLTISDIVNADYPVIALTDIKNMYGAKKFFSEMKKAKKVPLIGCIFEAKIKSKSKGKLILLAKNSIGYDNLCKLISLGKDNYLTDFELSIYNEGLVAISPGKEGELYFLDSIKSSNFTNVLNTFVGIYGEDFYYGVSYDMDRSYIENIQVAMFNKRIKTVLINCGRYQGDKSDEINKSYKILALSVFSKAATQKALLNLNDYLYSDKAERFLKYDGVGGALDLFKGNDKILWDTLEIVRKCDKFTFREINMSYDEGRYTNIKKTCLNNQKNQNVLDTAENFKFLEKLNKEIALLIVIDIYDFCKANNIFLAIKNSQGMSYILYELGIIKFNPMQYKIENKEYKDSLSIEMEIESDKKAQLIDYLAGKYPNYNFDHISTQNNFTGEIIESTTVEVLKNNNFMSTQQLVDMAKATLIDFPMNYKTNNEVLAIYPKDVYIAKVKVDNRLQVCDTDLKYFDFLKISISENTTLKNLNDTFKEVKQDVSQILLYPEVFEILYKAFTFKVFALDKIDFLSRKMNEIFYWDTKEELLNRLADSIALLNSHNEEIIANYVTKAMEKRKNRFSGPLEVLNSTYGVLVYLDQLISVIEKLTNMNTTEVISLTKSLLEEGITERFISVYATKSDEAGYYEEGKKFYDDFLTKVIKKGCKLITKEEAMNTAWVSYLTIYAIKYYPSAYFKNVLNTTNDEDLAYAIDIISKIVSIKAPNVINSDLDFSVEDGTTIIYGLNRIKGINFKNKPVYDENLRKFLLKNMITREEFLALAGASALVSYGYSYKYLCENVDSFDLTSLLQVKMSDLIDGLQPTNERKTVTFDEAKQKFNNLFYSGEVNTSYTKGLVSIKEIVEKKESYNEEGTPVWIIGTVIKNEVVPYSNGNGFRRVLTIGENNSSLKVNIFQRKFNNEMYDKSEGYCEGTSLVILGKVTNGKYGLSAMAESITPVSSLNPKIRKIIINVPNEEILKVLDKYLPEKTEPFSNIPVEYGNTIMREVSYNYMMEIEILKFKEQVTIMH